jgi:predicted DNA-binding transcriptional regulator AlpA
MMGTEPQRTETRIEVFKPSARCEWNSADLLDEDVLLDERAAAEKPAKPRPAPPCLALRPKDAAKALSIGQRLLWSLTNQNLIPHVRLGKAIVYPRRELERWLAEQAAKGVRR